MPCMERLLVRLAGEVEVLETSVFCTLLLLLDMVDFCIWYF